MRVPAAFAREDIKKLEQFPDDESIWLDIETIRRLSPMSLMVTELKSKFDLQIREKSLRFPFVNEHVETVWNCALGTEFSITGQSRMFTNDSQDNFSLALYDGETIWQFQHEHNRPKQWVNETTGRKHLMGKRTEDSGQQLSYQRFRLCFRDVARSTDRRSVISTIVPPNVFVADTLNVFFEPSTCSEMLILCAMLNSAVVDWLIRPLIDRHVNIFHVKETRIPRLMPGDRFFDAIVRRAAQLICTAPEYDDLAAEVGLGSHHNGVTDPAGRAKLRAELDGIIAHIYGLSEDEFAYVLSAFPLVAGSVKAAALDAYRAVARGAVT